MKDVGFGAEDVAKIDPRFVTYNDKGEVEGVKYDRLSVAFVNAFKEQQAQIESQQKQIEQLQSDFDAVKARNRSQQAALERQQSQIDSLMKLICKDKQDEDVCKQP